MTILVIAEHDNAELKPVTLNTLAAAKEIGSDIHLLVAGNDCQTVADTASQIPVVTKVLLADSAAYEHQLAENLSKLVLSVAADYPHILASATTTGKTSFRVLPRCWMLIRSQTSSRWNLLIPLGVQSMPVMRSQRCNLRMLSK